MITSKSNPTRVGNASLISWPMQKPSAVLLTLALSSLHCLQAQTFTTLHSFTGNDGIRPISLALSGKTLYLTAQIGGVSGTGALSAIETNGLDFSSFYSFSSVDPNTCVNSGGAYPFGGFIASGNVLYGSATYGGCSGNGSLCACQMNGGGFINLYNFSAVNPNTGANYDGAYPGSNLILCGNTLYGTAQCGGSSGSGTIFRINSEGKGFECLYSFSQVDPISGENSDGACPSANLMLSGSTLYGTASQGGNFGNGTVFKIKTDGTGFMILHSFTATRPPLAGSFAGPVNSDGTCPLAGLILSSNNLYGTASHGGGSGNGTVFFVDKDGQGFTNLHSFSSPVLALSGPTYAFTNSDGTVPSGNLILSGNTLYGTASHGGGSGRGTVFAINRDGTAFTNLHSFEALNPNSPTKNDGAIPSCLILSGATLYGTTVSGGASNCGTVFSLSFESAKTASLPRSDPELTMTRYGTKDVLSWPSAAAGYTLQSTTNLLSPVVWITVDGQFQVTNQMSDKQRFYRVIQ